MNDNAYRLQNMFWLFFVSFVCNYATEKRQAPLPDTQTTQEVSAGECRQRIPTGTFE